MMQPDFRIFSKNLTTDKYLLVNFILKRTKSHLCTPDLHFLCDIERSIGLKTLLGNALNSLLQHLTIQSISLLVWCLHRYYYPVLSTIHIILKQKKINQFVICLCQENCTSFCRYFNLKWLLINHFQDIRDFLLKH